MESDWTPEKGKLLGDLLERYAVQAGVPSGSVGSDPLNDLIRLGSRLFLIDEPEAHLHPTAQREAVSWLEDQVRLGRGQFIISTHSPAFLSLSGTSLTHVDRDEAFRVRLRSLDPRDLNALDPVMRALGFDRGELLAMHRAVLFVEGATDRAVIEALYGQRLRELGVWIQPFHGVRTHRHMTEAETLLRVLGPPFHVLVDNMSDDERVSVLALTEPELKHMAKKAPSDEARFVAAIRLASLREGRDVLVHAIPTRDILGLLDDEVVAEVAREWVSNCRPYPGFAKVLEEARERDARYDDVLRDLYSVPKQPEFFSEVAIRMRDRGSRSIALEAVLDEIWLHVAG
jgi:energy-coupling factor transporter ATP-binding protein EcfA2